MRLLLVEDDEAAAAQLLARLRERGMHLEATHVISREGAEQALAAHAFDFIVCGLELPSADHGDDLSVQHGFSVYQRIIEESPGTPVLFLTAQGDLADTRERLAVRESVDLFGDGEPYPLTHVAYKDESPSEIDAVEAFAQRLCLVDALPLDGPALETLSGDQQRAVRIFARRHEATAARVEALGSGLSGTTTVRVELVDGDGAYFSNMIAKLASLPDTRHERDNYRSLAVRLSAASYAPLVDEVMAGCGKTGGLFFSLATDHGRTLYSLAQRDDAAAAAAVRHLREVLEPWRGSPGEPEEELVSALRRTRIGNTTFHDRRGPLEGSEWQAFEALHVPVRRSLQHGDLHGANVLVDEAGSPLLIDFGDVMLAPSCTDPIVLELSLLFQADSPFRGGAWPAAGQGEAWADLDAYLEGCPVPLLVRACREWALQAAADERGVCAVAYSEAVRQFEYVEDRQELAAAIARGALRRGLALADAAARGGGSQ